MKRKHPRLPVRCRYKNEIWCMDLAQVDKLAEFNSGVKYLMIIVDLFSRFVRVGTMRNKNAESAKACFISLCSQKNDLTFPKKLWIDSGKEFLADFKNFCEDAGITVYHIHTEKKALYAERYIQSLKNIMYRYMEDKDTLKYVPAIPNFVKTLNSRLNTTTGLAPEKVENKHFLQVLYNGKIKKLKIQKPKFELGDKVRLAYDEFSFRKGYKPQFTDRIYTVEKISTDRPIVTFKIKDSENKILDGRYYEQELQKVNIRQ